MLMVHFNALLKIRQSKDSDTSPVHFPMKLAYCSQLLTRNTLNLQNLAIKISKLVEFRATFAIFTIMLIIKTVKCRVR